MQMTTLAPATYRRMPWKNGLGETTELVRAPRDGDPDWRISIARVTADGPFSHYPGYDRVILALDGDGLVLTHHDTGTEVAIGVLEPWDFSGDLTTSCVVRGGAFRDFNVFTRRAAFTAEVKVLALTKGKTLSIGADATILYCAEGSIVLSTPDRIDLQSDETVVIEPTGPDDSLTIEPGGLRATVVQVELTRKE
ncbi:MAG: HutD family protein [Thermoanaerobaculia bacterium]